MKIPPVPIHYSPSFLKTKSRMEKCRLDFSTCLEEDYNAPFSMDEFSCALARGKDPAPGPDLIHNQMLKHLPEEARLFLLRIFNKIGMEYTFPRTGAKQLLFLFLKKESTGQSHQPTTQSRSQAVYANFWSEWWTRVWSGTWNRETYLHPSNAVSGRTDQPWTTLSPLPHRSPLLSCYVNTW